MSEILALGFCDGPTSGVGECGSCHANFRFELLAEKSYEDVRIFSFATLPKVAFKDIVRDIVEAALAISELQRPVWVSIWQFATEELRTQMIKLTRHWRKHINQAWLLLAENLARKPLPR